MAYLPFLAAATFLLFLQALLPPLLAWAPDFGPLLAVYLGLFARRDRLAVAVLCLGLLRSALDLQPLGAMVLILAALAYAVALVRGMVFGERLAAQWVVSFFGGALYVLLFAAARLLLPMGGREGVGGLVDVALATLAATLPAPLVFATLRALRVGP